MDQIHALQVAGDGAPQQEGTQPAGAPSKACRVCGVTKPRSEYHRNHSKQDELEDVCKPCKALRDAARRRQRAKVRALMLAPSGLSRGCKKHMATEQHGSPPVCLGISIEANHCQSRRMQQVCKPSLVDEVHWLLHWSSAGRALSCSAGSGGTLDGRINVHMLCGLPAEAAVRQHRHSIALWPLWLRASRQVLYVLPRLALQVTVSVETKVCKKCHTEKAASAFPRNKLTNDGLHSYCKCAGTPVPVCATQNLDPSVTVP